LLEELSQLRELAQSALTEMRCLILHRRPAELHEQGLVQALRRHSAAVAAASGLAVEVIACEDFLIDQNLEEDLFRLVQEALNNVVKHAKAQTVRVELGRDGKAGQLSVEVEDDGVGIAEGSDTSTRLGMTTMRERVRRHGGDFSVSTGDSGRGTMIRASIAGALASSEALGR
jgi:signal transduction histidine kinase